MAADVTGYGVVPAALRIKYDAELQRDHRWLYLELTTWLEVAGEERRIFQRWLNGVRPTSAQ